MPIPAHLSHLLPKRLERGFDGYALSHFVLYTAPGCPPELLLDPDFWVHVVSRLRPQQDGRPPSHQILVIALDGSFEADLRVMAVDPRGLWAQMRLLREWPLGVISDALKDAPEPVSRPIGKGPDGDGYLIEFSGPQRWRIVRGTDVVATDLPDEAAAAAALANIKAAKQAKAA